MKVSFLIGTLCLFFASHAPAQTQDPKPALRLLRDECLGCHKPGKAKGGLLLTSLEKALQGGDSGPAIKPGKATDSLLYQTLLPDAESQMPPKKPLTADAIRSIQTWIDAGAQWDSSVFDEPPQIHHVQLEPVPPSHQPVLSLAISADGSQLAVARGAHISLYDLTQKDFPKTRDLPPLPSEVTALGWSTDGSHLAAAAFRVLRLIDPASGKTHAELTQNLIGPITALAFHPGKPILYAADGETGGLGFLHQISLPKATLSHSWKAHDDNILALTLSADGRQLASAGADRIARLWDTASRKQKTFFEGHTNHITGIAFNHDASQLATAGADREVKVWDTATRNQIAILGDKKSAFTTLSWTPDGKSLATLNDKGIPAIYTELQSHTGEQRSAAGKEKKLPTAPDLDLASLAITPDSTTLFAGSFTGRVHVWDIASGKVLEPLSTTPKRE
jgi:WD40 repeat protein